VSADVSKQFLRGATQGIWRARAANSYQYTMRRPIRGLCVTPMEMRNARGQGTPGTATYNHDDIRASPTVPRRRAFRQHRPNGLDTRPSPAIGLQTNAQHLGTGDATGDASSRPGLELVASNWFGTRRRTSGGGSGSAVAGTKRGCACLGSIGLCDRSPAHRTMSQDFVCGGRLRAPTPRVG